MNRKTLKRGVGCDTNARLCFNYDCRDRCTGDHMSVGTSVDETMLKGPRTYTPPVKPTPEVAPVVARQAAVVNTLVSLSTVATKRAHAQRVLEHQEKIAKLVVVDEITSLPPSVWVPDPELIREVTEGKDCKAWIGRGKITCECGGPPCKGTFKMKSIDKIPASLQHAWTRLLDAVQPEHLSESELADWRKIFMLGAQAAVLMALAKDINTGLLIEELAAFEKELG